MILFKRLGIALVFLSFSSTIFAQQIWQGQYDSKRIVLTNSSYTNFGDSLHISSPENSLTRLPLEQIKKGDSLILTNENYNLVLKTKKIKEQSFKAEFMYYGKTHPIVLKKVDSLEPISFPQHPKGKLPYKNYEISFKGQSTSLDYGGTLTLPKKQKKYPLVFLLNGSGQQDRNYSYSGHQFFTVLADALARKGVASFRMDDRGTGKTTGDFKEATVKDFVTDLEEAKTYLKSLDFLDYSFLGVLGHSEGGVTASIATAQNDDLKFMITLSGVGVSGLKILDLQNRAILNSYNIADTTVRQQMNLYNSLFKTVYDTNTSDSLEIKLESTVKLWMQDKNEETLKSLGLADQRYKNLIYRFYSSAKSDAYRYMIHYKPQDYLPKIEVPVLVLNGGEDILVPAEENVLGFEKYLINSPDFSSKIYPGLNHMYQHCKTCTSEEINTLEEVFAPEVLNDISEWIINIYNN